MYLIVVLLTKNKNSTKKTHTFCDCFVFFWLSAPAASVTATETRVKNNLHSYAKYESEADDEFLSFLLQYVCLGERCEIIFGWLVSKILNENASEQRKKNKRSETYRWRLAMTNKNRIKRHGTKQKVNAGVLTIIACYSLIWLCAVSTSPHIRLD